jgi:integral membrane protein (TIGR01906 family)
MKGTWVVVGWLVPVALMLLLVTSNVRFTANSLSLYEALFDRNHVPARSGLPMPELLGVGQQIQDYFGSDTEPLVVTAAVNGVELELFEVDEVSHMSDVKQLFLKTYRLQAGASVALVLASAAAAYHYRKRALDPLSLWVQRGAIISATTIVVIGGASVVAFDEVFLLFHKLGFPQGNFLFDTRNDYLVRVFPLGFWEDMTLLIGLLTLLEAAALYGLGLTVPRLARRRKAQAAAGKR